MFLEGRCSAKVASLIGATSTALGLGDPIFSVARLDGEPHSRQLARWRAQEVSANTTNYVTKILAQQHWGPGRKSDKYDIINCYCRNVQQYTYMQV